MSPRKKSVMTTGRRTVDRGALSDHTLKKELRLREVKFLMLCTGDHTIN